MALVLLLLEVVGEAAAEGEVDQEHGDQRRGQPDHGERDSETGNNELRIAARRELVAHPGHCLDKARRPRVLAQLATQVLHVGVDRALVSVVVVSLDAGDELVPGQDPVGVPGEGREEVELTAGQRDAPPVDGDLPCVPVE